MRPLFYIALLLAGCDTSSLISLFMMNVNDMATDQWWHSGTALPSARQSAAVATLDGKLYVIGGLDAASVPLASVTVLSAGKWSDGPALPEPLASANVAVIDKQLYLLGALGSSHSYVFDGGTWTPIAPIPTERGAAMVGAIDNLLYVAGGERGGAAVDEVAAYDPASDSWVTRSPLPKPVAHIAGAVIGKIFYAGDTAYDPGSNAWFARAAMPFVSADYAAVALENSYIVAAPEGVARYTPILDRWSLLAPMPTPRHALGGALLDGAAHFPGGAGANGASKLDEVLQP